MELRRAADKLLRSQTTPLSSIINPRSTLRWTNKAQLECRCTARRPPSRYLSATSQNNAVKPIPTTTSTSSPPSTTQSPSTNPQNPSGELSSLLGWTQPSTNKPPASRFPFPPRASGEFEKSLNGGSSSSDLLSSLASLRSRRMGLTSQSPQNSSNTSGVGSIQIDKMLDPSNPASYMGSGANFMSETANETMIHKSKRVTLKLSPSTGRSVVIGSTGIEIGRGFKLLEQSCARNKIKADAGKQRFHERGGLKRKRLRRERWRRRFLDGFKATVGRVKQLKNQGW